MIFVICDIIFIIIFILFFPETKNKTLEEIGLLFGDEVCQTNVKRRVEKTNKCYFRSLRHSKRLASMWTTSYTNTRSMPVPITSTKSSPSMHETLHNASGRAPPVVQDIEASNYCRGSEDNRHFIIYGCFIPASVDWSLSVKYILFLYVHTACTLEQSPGMRPSNPTMYR